MKEVSLLLQMTVFPANDEIWISSETKIFGKHLFATVSFDNFSILKELPD